jgi:hypothetical protein
LRLGVLSSDKASPPVGTYVGTPAVPPTPPPVGSTPVEFVAECELPTARGDFRLRAYRAGGSEPTVVVKGDVRGGDVLVRVHDQVGPCATGALGGKRTSPLLSIVEEARCA